MMICPECGRAIYFNSYFDTYVCHDCGWYEGKKTEKSTTDVDFESINYEDEDQLLLV